MIGAILGDIIGSRHEIRKIKSMDFELFTESSKITDDTVMTIAIADSILNDISFKTSMLHWGNEYFEVGYGGNFKEWLKGKIQGAYNSYGNGSAMRVSPCGYMKTLEECLQKAEESALPTHNHPEGIKGAQSIAAAIFLARQKKSKEEIKKYIETTFGYDLSKSPDEIRPTYTFDVSCQGSVPESICCFLHSTDFESTIRLAISLGGDADTQAAIAGSIAEAYYNDIPNFMIEEMNQRLPDSMKQIVREFYKKFMPLNS